MSIKIHYKSLQTTSLVSDEDDAAQDLVERFKAELSQYPNAKGDIHILSSVTLFAQKRRDIDLLIFGFLENLVLHGKFNTKNNGEINSVGVKNFLFNIELKSHPVQKVTKSGTDYFVVYNNSGKHNASQQCSEAKFSLINHLSDQLGIHPFLCDFLWFRGITKENLAHLRGSQIDNALHCSFSFKELIYASLYQANVRKDEIFYLDSFPDGRKSYNSVVDLFTAVRSAKGLTKKKFEMISQQSTNVDTLVRQVGDKFTILTGRAGTGKTIQLLQLAFKLADTENQNRCLILTYNNALVSDIQRLIDYTPMPSRVDGRTVSIRTIHSFFQSLISALDISQERLIPTHPDYSLKYYTELKKLYHYVVKECDSEDMETLKDIATQPIDWDFILIDEAQDFEDIEKEILFKIYGPHRIIVADGVDQFMRTGVRQNWDKQLNSSSLFKPKAMTLERRQKANLVRFVNAFSKLSNLDWSVVPNYEIPGGQVKIYQRYNTDIHIDLKKNCNDNGCENYDILILEPPTMIGKTEKGLSYFKNYQKYVDCGISLFDGTNASNRTTYPTKDQCRLYQYDSCRGLEGWCVVCDKFDELYQYKINTFVDNNNALGLDRDKIKKRNVLLWMLMPLTRPIDTLVITLTNPNCEIGRMLYHLSQKYEDFIEWNIK